jgi:hypothetical protein
VYQREALFGFLKVREHLIFHAVARMGRDHSHKAIMARVEQVGRCVSVCLDAGVWVTRGSSVEAGGVDLMPTGNRGDLVSMGGGGGV